jgi:hypothetical protein
MPVIRTRQEASKPKPRARTKQTAATKPAPRKRQAAKPAAESRTNRSSKTDLSQRELNAILNPLSKAAQQREKHYEAWKEHVSAVNEMIVEALDAEIPVHMIVDSASVSRQHVYKIISDMKEGRRTNGGQATGKAGRPRTNGEAKKPAARKPAARKAAAKPGRRPAGKAATKPRARIRTRS